MTHPKCPKTGKACYTKAVAKSEARRQGRWTLGHLSSYKCEHRDRHPKGAGLFHIGHTPSRRKKGRRR